MPTFELALLNIAHLKALIDSLILKLFITNLNRIDSLADSEGFCWRLVTDSGEHASMRRFGNDVQVNMFVWRDLASLLEIVRNPAHAEIMRRRRGWLVHPAQPYAVLWLVPFGHRPPLAKAADRLGQLRQRGPSSTAFTFGSFFPVPAVGTAGESLLEL